MGLTFAGILIGAPVLGLRPIFSGMLFGSKDPKPNICIECPSPSAAVTDEVKALISISA